MSKFIYFLELVRSEVSKSRKLDPIHDDYNHAQFISCIDQIAQEQPNEISNSTVFKALVAEISLCFSKLNEAYEDVMAKIEDTLDHIDLSDRILFEKCLLLTNLQLFNASQMLETDRMGDTRKLALSGLDIPKRDNIFGEEISLQDAVDYSVDS